MATLEQIEAALRAADAAGNEEDARQLAQAYAQMRSQQPGTSPGVDPEQRAKDIAALQEEQRRADAEATGFGENLAAGFGRSAVETWRGLKQAGYAVGDAIPGVDLSQERAEYQREVDEARRVDEALLSSAGGATGNILGAGLQTAVPVGGPGLKLASLAGKAAPYAGAAARGAAYAGSQTVSGDESRLGNAAIGAGAGAAGQGIATWLGKGASAARERLSGPIRESIEAAKRAGIPLSVSQVANSRFVKGLGSVASALPLTGGARAAARQQEGFNRAVGRTFGVENATALTDDVMQQVRQGIGAVYDEVFSRNSVSLDRSAIDKLLRIEREAALDMTTDQAQVVRNQVQRIVDEFTDGSVAGQKYQALRSSLAKLADNSTLGRSIKELRSVVDDAAFRSVGKADAESLKKANSMWANMRTAEKSLQQVAGSAGNVRPSSLYPLIRNGSTQEMRELAKIGQNVLKDPIPNSGTPERQFIYNLLGLGGGAAAVSSDSPLLKLAGAGLLGGRAMNSPLAARALMAAQPAAVTALEGLARIAPRAALALPGAAMAGTQDVPLEIDVTGGRVGQVVTEDELEELRRRGRSP